jgi:putative transposase
MTLVDARLELKYRNGGVRCYDNAPMESYWGTLNSELVHHRRYGTRKEAIREINEYMEIFCRRRRQAGLGYFSPVAYERRFFRVPIAA